MCRLFCTLAKEKINLNYYLFDAKYSIIKQAKYEKQDDGWGTVIYDKNKPSFIIKSIKPFYEEKIENLNIFNPKLVLFFVREASNPRNIDKKLLINIEATQPFFHQNISFAHNGSIEIPDEVIQSLGNFKYKPLSLNDSEAYFICFLKFFEEEKDVFKALKKTEDFIVKTYNETKTNKKRPYSSLNVIISDGYKIYALNKYLINYKQSLIDPNREYYKMCYYADEEKLIIASEPIEEDGWKDLGNNKFIEGYIEEGKVQFKISDF